MKNVALGSTSSGKEFNVVDRVASDLLECLQPFRTQTDGLLAIGKQTGLSEATLKRILSRKNRPTTSTIMKIYRYIHSSTNDTWIYSQLPSQLQEYVAQNAPYLKKTTTKAIYHKNIEEQIQSDSIFREIYLRSCTGPFYLEEIRYRLGELGVDTLKRMVDSDVISYNDKKYGPGKNRSPLHGDTLKLLTGDLLNKFFHPGKCQADGENSIYNFYAGLNEEGYNEWLKILLQAFQQIQQIVSDKKYQGNIRAWTALMADTFSREMIYLDNKDDKRS